MAVPLDKEQDQRYGVANALGGLTAEIGIAAVGLKASALAAAATASTGVGFAAAPFVYLAGSFGSGYGASIANQSITDPDGSIYFGEWDNGFPNGKGIETWADGRKYIGEWVDNQSHGKGIK